MIEFYDSDGVIGRVEVDDDGEPTGDVFTREFIKSWEAHGDDLDFETYYDGWSNGYVHARRID